MIKSASKILLSAAALLGFGGAASAQTVDLSRNDVIPYVIDQRGVLARSGFGLCWRTGYWTPAAAQSVMYGKFPVGCECDKDLMPKEQCEPPAEVAKAATAGPKPAAKKVTLAADALFDFDKATLRPEGKAKFDKLVEDIKGINLEVIIAAGHADRIGSDQYNQGLSERRAAAVKDYLVGKGIDANRVYAEGKGEKQPVTGDKCGTSVKRTKKLIECLQPDRRVEIEIIGTQK